MKDIISAKVGFKKCAAENDNVAFLRWALLSPLLSWPPPVLYRIGLTPSYTVSIIYLTFVQANKL